MSRFAEYLPIWQQQMGNKNIPEIILSKCSKRHEISGVISFDSYKAHDFVSKISSQGVLVIGGMVSSLLKLGLNSAAMLIIDEASMMVFPQFLALATLIRRSGTIMLAGDHRQLAPIVAHNWEREDRPPMVKYQPFMSAYQAVDQLKTKVISDRSLITSSLNYTFRLPEQIRQLIAPVYRHRDGIELEGNHSKLLTGNSLPDNPWCKIWHYPSSLLLVVHSESSSQKSNPTEVAIIERILAHRDNLRPNSVAIITPHRAQRTQLKTHLNEYKSLIKVIDTVEKLQGGECENIFVSATASDPIAIGKNVEFILNLNRSNVAFSRVQQRLVVVCSQSIINYIPAEIEFYEETLLWNNLRSLCSECLDTITVENIGKVEFFVPRIYSNYRKI